MKVALARNCSLSILLVWAMTSCGGESIDLTPRMVDAGLQSGDAGPLPLDSGPDLMSDSELDDERWPSLELFVQNVQPTLTGCGNLTCHKAEMVSLDDQFLQFETDPGGLVNDLQAANNFAEFTQERLIDYEAPEESKFLRHHPLSHPGFILAGSMTEALVLEWIADALTPPGTMMPMQRPIDYRCDELEIGDQQQAWREAYEAAGVNRILVGTLEMPGGRCGGSDCHAGPNGGRLLFAPREVACSDDYNFLEAGDWVNFDEPLSSPLLVKPLGEPSQVTGRIEHGGRVVFNGRDDEDYITLRRWIEAR